MKEKIRIARNREVLSLITGVTYTNVPSWYGATRKDLHMDLIVPKYREAHAPLPVILWFCGGAFRVMDRSVWIPELVDLARGGFVVASVEYRTGNEAVFPAQLEDAMAAVRFLKEHASDYSIDPTRMFSMGESAGGSIASLLGTSGCVQGVVDFYGLVDLTSVLVEGPGNDTIPAWTLEEYLGVGYGPEQAVKASALLQVTPDTPPHLILHGTEDQAVDPAQSRRYYEKLVENGVPATLLEIEGAGHGDDLFYEKEIKDRILQFLKGI